MDKITLKFHDNVKEIDLTSEEGQAKIKELAEKGYAYEEGQTKLNSVEQEKTRLQEEVNRWNEQLTRANGNPEETQKLIDRLKQSGINLTFKEKEDSEYLDTKAQEEINKLNVKIDDLAKNNDKLQGYVLNQFYDTEHAQNEAQFTESNGYPKYDRTAVQKYADDKGIVSFKTAYLELNQEDIIKSKVEFEKNKTNRQTEKIKKVAVDIEDKGESIPQSPKIHNKYSDASREYEQELAAGTAQPLVIKQ